MSTSSSLRAWLALASLLLAPVAASLGCGVEAGNGSDDARVVDEAPARDESSSDERRDEPTRHDRRKNRCERKGEEECDRTTAADPCDDDPTTTLPVTITIAPDTLEPSTIPLGSTVAHQLTPSGGVAPYGFALYSGSLPPGVAFSSSGTMNGMPTMVGTYTFAVVAVDTSPFPGPHSSAPKSYTLTIVPATITILPATLGPAKVGVPFEQQLTSSGGFAPYAYSLSTGSLPPGIAFSSAGKIAGTPVAAGTFTFAIRSTDAFGSYATITYTSIVDP